MAEPRTPSPGSVLPTPLFDDGIASLFHGDCREIMPAIGEVDCVVTDPPYGETSLEWDVRPTDWLPLVPGNSLWVFGSLSMFMETAHDFAAAAWKKSQEIVWEKHNGSSFHADRFKRVHELAVHFYRGAWSDVYHVTPTTNDATARVIRRRKQRPEHTGHIDSAPYASENGGPRLMRSVIYCRSAHGQAVHPTQKPEGIIRPLIEYACPPNGIVLDPFAGSGSTGLAARQTGRCSILIEREFGYAQKARDRLSQMELVA